jgi:hypothetical protein
MTELELLTKKVIEVELRQVTLIKALINTSEKSKCKDLQDWGKEIVKLLTELEMDLHLIKNYSKTGNNPN